MDSETRPRMNRSMSLPFQLASGSHLAHFWLISSSLLDHEPEVSRIRSGYEPENRPAVQVGSDC